MTDRQEHALQQSSSFLNGFALGLFVGAAGYYLYATDRGKKLREHMVAEWQVAKTELAKEGVITRPDISLREFLFELIQNTFGGKGDGAGAHPHSPTPREHRLIAETPKIAQRKTARSFYQTKKETTRKFKGV